MLLKNSIMPLFDRSKFVVVPGTMKSTLGKPSLRTPLQVNEANPLEVKLSNDVICDILNAENCGKS